MYFTIPKGAPSTGALTPDALGSYQRLRQHAATLGSLSASFLTEAEAVTESYVAALSLGDRDAWSSFVADAASLVRHSESVDSIVHLDARERAAQDFFAQITRENDDLI
jgi:hypothetical protein